MRWALVLAKLTALRTGLPLGLAREARSALSSEYHSASVWGSLLAGLWVLLLVAATALA
jgi:hypothetical protein